MQKATKSVVREERKDCVSRVVGCCPARHPHQKKLIEETGHLYLLEMPAGILLLEIVSRLNPPVLWTLVWIRKVVLAHKIPRFPRFYVQYIRVKSQIEMTRLYIHTKHEKNTGWCNLKYSSGTWWSYHLHRQSKEIVKWRGSIEIIITLIAVIAVDCAIMFTEGQFSSLNHRLSGEWPRTNINPGSPPL